jgi:hypothetical protein
MSGPDGQVTKRDQRREARRQQLRQQQTQRQRQRQQAIRQQRIRTGAIFVGILLAVVIIGLLVAHFAFGAFGTASAPVQQAANGQVIDGLACAPPSSNAHYGFSYVKLYVNGQQQEIPAGVGIVSAKNCRYPVFVPTGQPNATAALAGNQKYVLGNLFSLWGQPLSSQQVLGNKADVSHPLTYEVAEANGQLAPYTGDPRGIELRDYETIVILYNSPHVKAAPFTDWGSLHS